MIPNNELNINIIENTSQIQRKPNYEPQKLFKYYIDKNMSNDAKEEPFFYRLNRFRFNSYNQSRCNHDEM